MLSQPDTTVPSSPKPRTTPAPSRLDGTLRPIKPQMFGYEQARHLLWRAGFGGNDDQIRTLMAWGPQKSVDYLLDLEKIEYPRPKQDQFDKDIMRPPTDEERRLVRDAQRSQDEDKLAQIRLERQKRQREDREQIAQMQKWWLTRMIETPRPLEEKMTLFWHGLLSTNYRTIENSYHMFLQNGLFRTHALGSYADLLHSLIRDPAMIAYLNNNDSRKDHPNENLAREIMELFSLGVGNYSEKDIKEGARALTGYTFDDDAFVFRRNNHDTGEKSILGARGTWDGDAFVDIILRQPACARYITRRLYHFFLADVPTDERGGENLLEPAQRSVLHELAQTFSSANYELRPVLKRLFLSEHFYDPRFMNQQIKSPVMLVVGAVRSLNAPVRDLGILNDALDLMGQKIFFPPSVKGWEGGRAWINTSTYYVRQNVLAFLLAGKKPQGYDASVDTTRYDAMSIFEKAEPGSALARHEPRAVVEALLKLALGFVPASAVDPLLSFIASRENTVNNETMVGLLLLITAMPEYQLC